MKYPALILAALVLVFGFSCKSADCGGSGAQCPATANCPTSAAQGKSLCGSCGQIKGAPNCCLDGAEKCSGCDLDKGSPGCCKMEKGKDAKLCACGEIGGSDACKAKCAKKAACCAAPGSDACKTKCGK
ncbi:MAG: hypothetical protein GY930_10015 [bacterium]|nr:hypothetical protein [bacterium]